MVYILYDLDIPWYIFCMT